MESGMGSDSGKEFWVVCPVCYKANPADTKYCKYCWGAALGSQPQIAAADLPAYQQKLLNRVRKRKLYIRLGIITSFVLLFVTATLWSLYKYSDVMAPIKADVNSNSRPGEWAMFRHDLSNSGVSGPTDVVPAGKVKWIFNAGNVIRSSATVVNGTVYFGCRDWKLHAVDAETGVEKWSFLTGSRVESSPAVVNGIVYFGSNDGNMYALDAETGQQIWFFETPYPVVSSPAVADGKVFFGADDYHVYALNAATGKQIWKFNAKGPVGASPVVANGMVYVGCGVEYVYVLNANNGLPRLRFRVYESTYGTPAVSGSTAYISNFKGDIYVFDGSNRNWLLEYEMKPIWIQIWAWGLAPTPPVQSGFLWALRLFQPMDSSPALSADGLYLGAGTSLYHVDLAERKTIWNYPTNGKIVSCPALLDSMVIFGSLDGNLYAVDSHTGNLKWQFETGGSILASPTVADGVVYIGSEDGNLYALE